MLNESRRRAYLTAMQVVNWLPRTELPFAAPSRPQLLVPLPLPVEVQRVAPAASPAEHAAPAETSNVEPMARQPERPRVEV
ncbi:energy transducer TonB, partial [Pseudomonas syringae]